MEGNKFEQKTVQSVGRTESVLKELLPFVRVAYEKAKRMIDAGAIDPRNFVHPYGKEVINRDMKWVEDVSKKHNENLDVNKVHADIIEAILYEHIEQSNWFGENATTIKTSKFDDIRNGVDIIIEFEEGVEHLLRHLGLAVDVTFGEKALQEKILKIKEEIQNGKLAEIKYFESDRSPHKGLFQRLPRVVVGVDRSHMIDLIRMWTDDSRKKEFTTHPVQKLILHEIEKQLKCFIRFSEQCNQPDIMEIYRTQLVVIQRILSEKSDIDSNRYEEIDGVNSGIQKQLELF